ncbi:MAG: fumarylacetoacetate hydrolase family protein [Burkholderiaceae bacterium]|nr:fumarylacetoacetate hydrolase family protein [Burkholderiaceae bacterium]
MLMSNQINRYAHQLLDARSDARLIAPLSSSIELKEDDAYSIARRIHDVRVAEGEVPAGRKIGFVNRTIWPKNAQQPTVHAPIWAPLFGDTIVYAEDNAVVVSLKGLLQPRIEPEIVFRLGKTPAVNCTLEELADCIEWMAHGVEIDSCPFPEWKFKTADAIAAYGLHGKLIVGEPRVVSAQTRQHLSTMMMGVSVSVACDGALRAAGFGSDILNSPLHALWHLHQMLGNQTRFGPLEAGEIITTGSWADAQSVAPNQIWQTAFSGIALPGLTIELTE